MKSFLKYLCVSFLIFGSGMLYAQESVTLDVNYSVEVAEGSMLNGSAVITFCGRGFSFAGNGIESHSDGESVWVIDTTAREVYVESVTPESEAYMDELGTKLSAMKAGASMSFLSPENQEVLIKVNAVRKSDGKPLSSFRPTMDFDSSWVVTDLR